MKKLTTFITLWAIYCIVGCTVGTGNSETSTYTFMDYTSVTQKDDTANKGILKDIQPRYAQLTIQNNSSYDLLNVTPLFYLDNIKIAYTE